MQNHICSKKFLGERRNITVGVAVYMWMRLTDQLTHFLLLSPHHHNGLIIFVKTVKHTFLCSRKNVRETKKDTNRCEQSCDV